MASLCCLSAPLAVSSPSPSVKIPNGAAPRVVLVHLSRPCALRRRRRDLTVCMASPAAEDEEEEKPGRNPLDFPYDWVRPKPSARSNVFPKFPAMSTPLPTWLPHDEAPDDEIDEDEEEFEEDPQQEPGPDPYE